VVPSLPGWTGPTTGKLKINVHEARFAKDCESFGTMDPFVQVKSRNQEFKTKVHTDGGVNPKWEEVFEIDVKYIGDDVEFFFMNKNSMSDADNIGHLKCKMTALCANKGVDDWWDVMLKGKEVGKIHLSSNWIPDEIVKAGSQAAAAPAAPVQQPVMQVQ
jgi:Ca2+-dependent lipid-binding protein